MSAVTRNNARTLFVVLGNQLYPPALLSAHHAGRIFMAEDIGLCTYVRHHKQKIALFLAAMRAYRDDLVARGHIVHYEQLDPSRPDDDYESRLARCVRAHDIDHLMCWEIEDKFFETRVQAFAQRHRLRLTLLSSPMFLTSRAEFADWLASHRPHMATFYQWQRRRLDVLMERNGRPSGGRWSFDQDNRLALPRTQSIPPAPRARPDRHVLDVIPLILEHFAGHPGELSAEAWWLPTTRRQALSWLRSFLRERFDLFGPFEDALSRRGPVLFHSVLSPVLNLGLLTPREVLDHALTHAGQHRVRISSLEGFVRQIIGWREFVRGIYRHYSDRQESSNFFGHTRRLRPCWYEATTGLPPLDDVIRKALRYGWTHHIERLMVASNLMTLCEIEPRAACRWFMEMYVDSSDWVMGPNVFGMGLFSDGGIFATKPYVCGSNYLLRMGDDAKPPAAPRSGSADSWRDVMDGLYWRFVHRQRAFFRGQARMAQMVGTLDRIHPARRRRLFQAAENFIAATTR
mgnify:CR=1 FL=1